MFFIKTIKSEFLIIAKSKHKMYKLQKQDMFQVPWKVVVFDTHTDDNVSLHFFELVEVYNVDISNHQRF